MNPDESAALANAVDTAINSQASTVGGAARKMSFDTSKTKVEYRFVPRGKRNRHQHDRRVLCSYPIFCCCGFTCGTIDCELMPTFGQRQRSKLFLSTLSNSGTSIRSRS